MELLEPETIAEWEPRVALVNGEPRLQPIVAIGIRNSPTAVDYEALAESFVAEARRELAGSARELDLRLGTMVEAIEPEGDGFRVRLRPGPGSAVGPGELRARHVVVAAGAHSLLLAQRLGYGLEYSCLPVAGSFYFTPDLLNGKVYTVQNDKLPFAAIHGDPDVRAPGKTRFGPTALLLPLLERYRPASFWEFLRGAAAGWGRFGRAVAALRRGRYPQLHPPQSPVRGSLAASPALPRRCPQDRSLPAAGGSQLRSGLRRYSTPADRSPLPTPVARRDPDRGDARPELQCHAVAGGHLLPGQRPAGC